MTETKTQKAKQFARETRRLSNARNCFQGDRKRVLCVCTAGMLRSPTAAWILSNPPFDFNTRAAGVGLDCALVCVDEMLVTWADEIVCMSQDHKDSLEWGVKHFRNTELLQVRPVHVLNVPDVFEFREPKLVELMTEKLLVAFKFKEPEPVFALPDPATLPRD